MQFACNRLLTKQKTSNIYISLKSVLLSYPVYNQSISETHLTVTHLQRQQKIFSFSSFSWAGSNQNVLVLHRKCNKNNDPIAHLWSPIIISPKWANQWQHATLSASQQTCVAIHLRWLQPIKQDAQSECHPPKMSPRNPEWSPETDHLKQK